MQAEVAKMETVSDFQNKICKKIAQLTRVIVQLNVLNDDNEAVQRKLVAGFEKDLAQHTRTCKQLVEEERTRVAGELRTVKTLQGDFDRVKSGCEMEKNMLMSRLVSLEREAQGGEAVEALERKLAEKESKLLHATSTLKFIEENFDRLKQKFEGETQIKTEEIARLTRELASRSSQSQNDLGAAEKTIRQLQEDLAATEQRLEQEKVAKIKSEAELSERMRMLDERIADLISQVERRDEEAEAAEKRELALQEEARVLKSKLAELEEKVKERDASIKELLDNKEAVETSLRATAQRLKDSEEQVARLEAAVKDWASKKNDLESQKELLEEKIGQLEALGNHKDQKIGQLQEKVGELEGRVRGWEEQMKLSQGNYSESVISLNSQISEGKSKINELGYRIQEQRGQIEALNRRVQELEAESTRKTSELQLQKAAEKRMEELLENESARNRELSARLDALDSQKTQLAQQLEQSREQATALEGQLWECRQTISELTALVDQKAGKEQGMTSVIGEKNQEIERLKSQIQTLNDKSKSYLESSTAQVQRLTSRISELEADSDRLNQAVDQAKEARQRLIQRVTKFMGQKIGKDGEDVVAKMFKQNHARLSTKIQNLVTKIQGLVTYCSRLSELKGMLARTGQQVDSEGQRARDLEAKVGELRAALQKAEAFSDTLNRQLGQKNAEIDALNSFMESVKRQSQSTSAQLEDDLLKERKNSQTLLANLESKMKTAESEYKAKLQALLDSHSKELADQNGILRKAREDHDRQVAELRAIHQSEIAALSSQHAAQQQEATESNDRRLETLLRGAENQHKVVLKNISDDFQKRLAEVTAEKDSLTKSLNTLVASLKGELAAALQASKELHETTERLREDLQQSREESTRLAQRLAAETTNHLQGIERAAEEAKAAKKAFEAEVKRRYEVFKEGLENTMRSEIEDFQAVLDDLKARYDEERQAKDAQVAELHRLFKQRPSKGEDLEQISQLTDELQKKQAELEQVQQQLRFFRLELVNRDKNYNEIFNSNPHVGVLNPLSAQNVPSMANIGTKESLVGNANTRSTLGSKPELGRPKAQSRDLSKVTSKQFSIKTIMK